MSCAVRAVLVTGLLAGAILYAGDDGGGDTYVKLGGRDRR
jgi:hypothetical protein